MFVLRQSDKLEREQFRVKLDRMTKLLLDLNEISRKQSKNGY